MTSGRMLLICLFVPVITRIFYYELTKKNKNDYKTKYILKNVTFRSNKKQKY